jgi:putative nucleotidyltransferase with HDIG domain
MLKKISSSELRIGMHLQALCGNWTQHPFWRTQFLINDAATIARIVDSGIEEVWIDVSKGLDVAPPVAEPQTMPAVVATAPAPVAPPARPPAAAPVPPTVRASLQEEIDRAASVCMRSRKAVLNMFNEARLGKAVDARDCLPLVEEISGSVMRNPGAIVSLARLKTHDDYSYMHSVAVCALMVSLARQIGLDENEQRVAGLAGLLHDLGKAAMPLEVLNKPGKLTDAEYRQMRDHPQKGYEMLREAGSAGEAAMDVVLHHHERLDGKGYPKGLQGDQISRMARMGAICDVYDAVTSNRPYKEAWDPSEALARMVGWAPAHLDPTLVQAFVKALGIYPIGSLVRLQSGRLAVVVEQNSQSLTAPVVRVFFSTKSNLHITPELVNLAAAGCMDRVVSRESNKTWGFQHLDRLWASVDVLRKAGIGS